MQYPHSSYAPQPPRAGRSPAFYVAIVAIVVLVLGALGTCGVVGGLAILGSQTPAQEQGVIPGTQVPQKVTAALVAKKLLRADETLIVYYDGSVSLDMSEVSFVTRERVAYAKGDVVATIPLAEIAKITRKSEPLIGDSYDLTADDARTMRIEIAPLNGSDSFASALENAWQKQRSGAAITRLE